MQIGGIQISNYDTKMSPLDNYKTALIAEIITVNKSRLKLKKAFERAEAGYGQRIINGRVALNTIDFELWIKKELNDDSMVCLGDKIIREIKRIVDDIEQGQKNYWEATEEKAKQYYDKMGEVIGDAQEWVEDKIFEPITDTISDALSGLQDGLNDVFGTSTIISTYLSKELGYGKENEILSTLLEWKNSFILTDDKRKAQLILYYKSSKCLIKKCLRDNDLAKIYFYDHMVLKTYNLIKEDKPLEAFNNYRKYIMEMVAMYD